MFTADDGTEFPDGIPPQRIRVSVIAAMRTDAAALLPPQFRAVVERTEHPFMQPIVELSSSSLVAGRCILIGDAAFTVRPHIGLGVSKAAGDAMSLATVFSRDDTGIQAALRRWEKQRLRFGRAVLARSADLGCYLEGSPASISERERHTHFRQAEIVLAGIAAPEPNRFLNL
jgi:2-polyprenyl-6-methoxyphenol hydroxylase-like FAD-dependent oxidoreductase